MMPIDASMPQPLHPLLFSLSLLVLASRARCGRDGVLSASERRRSFAPVKFWQACDAVASHEEDAQLHRSRFANFVATMN
jgi:hypothetical protein